MAGVRQIPKGCQFWPDRAESLPELAPSAVVTMYEQGFAGAYAEPEEKERFQQWSASVNGFATGEDIAHASGFADSAAGKLVIPFVFIEKYFPGSLPASAQTRGDCVSHSTRNAGLCTLACDIASGKPDEVTGKIEGVPDLPPEGMRDGVLSTEAIYWWRGHGGDGWSCGHASRVISTQSGMWLRKNYPEFGVDLTRYSGSTAGKYGRSNPPDNYLQFGKQNLIRRSASVSAFEATRDFLANGYGISSCGSEGFSSARNADGVSDRRGSWAHAMAYLGADDRDITKQKYGEPLVLVQNSWGKWNSGPRTILGTDIQIPEGSFWAKWSALRGRDCYVYSSAAGWPAKNLPPFISPLG
jgi:hypothetical protein